MQRRLRFILLNGPMGSGKSTIANLLKNRMARTAILEIESIRRLVTGSEDNQLAWKVIYSMCDEYFRNEVSVLLQQTAASRDLVNRFLRLARKYNCSVAFYHLQAPRSELLKRIKARRESRNVPKSLISRNIQKHEIITYPSALMIDTSKQRPADVAELIARNLNSIKPAFKS